MYIPLTNFGIWALLEWKDTFPRRQMLRLNRKKLNEFELNFTSIVAITTDGAAVMKKLGGLVDTEHQLCLAHGLQLAVIKILQNLNFSEPESCAEEPLNEYCDEYDDDENDIQFTDGLIIANDSSLEIDENIMICVRVEISKIGIVLNNQKEKAVEMN